ncbi:MAG: hypothetical protein ACLFOY_08610 [Desulfatibacillaceae bacterium]
MTQINQINVTYNAAEDRLLLRLTAPAPEGIAEYRMWLTRRFVSLMWKGLEQVLESDTAGDPAVQPDTRRAVQQFREEAALSSADFKTPYNGGEAAVSPLGDEPLLVTRLNIRETGDEKKTLVFSDNSGRGITLTLAPHMIHSVRKLIADTARRAEWNLDISLYSQSELREVENQSERTLN